MNEITDLVMHNRKRCITSSNKKIIEHNIDFLSFIDFDESPSSAASFHKSTKIDSICDIDKNFTSTYFATPGECTRSKTVKAFNFNPFDLSKPDSDENYVFSLTCSTPLVPNASSKYRIKSKDCLDFEYSMDSGCETASVSESILSFASRSNSYDSYTSSQKSELSWSAETERLSTKLKQKSSPVKSCSDTGFLLPILSDSSSNNVLIPQISTLTLANLLSGNHTLSNKITIFDCRFPYEYSGGHVMNSSNVYTCQKLLQTLFPVKTQDSCRNLEQDINKMTARPRRNLKRDETIYIFYCQFSSYRGPKLAQCLRGLDRLANSGSRDLYFPHIYVLFNGYNDFFSEYPQFCSPNGYVSMKKNPYLLRHVNCQKRHRKEHLQYETEMRDSDKMLRDIIAKRTKDSDILQLFSSHPTVGGI